MAETARQQHDTGDLVVESREDADRALMRLGEVARARERLKARCEESIKRARERRKEAEAPLEAEAKIIERALQDWAKRDRKTWGKARSLRLRHGRVGWRQSTSLRLLKKAETVIKLLKARGLEECVKTRESVNRELLRQLDEESVRAVGAKLVRRDAFFVEPAREEAQ